MHPCTDCFCRTNLGQPLSLPLQSEDSLRCHWLHNNTHWMLSLFSASNQINLMVGNCLIHTQFLHSYWYLMTSLGTVHSQIHKTKIVVSKALKLLACPGGAIGSVAVCAAWLQWLASLGSRPGLAGSLCQVIAAYTLRLNSPAGTEGSTVLFNV